MEVSRRISRLAKGLRKSAKRITNPLERHLKTWSRESEVAGEIAAAKRARKLERVGPDFLIIGAPKCATSWLRFALSQHPEIITIKEELEYFSKGLHQPLKSYVSLFEAESDALDRLNSAYRRAFEDCMLGEKSASYCTLSRRRIRLIHQLVPEARLILVIRDPIRRHWAHAKRYFSKLYCNKKGLVLSDLQQGELFEFLRRTQAFSEYSTMIENWQSVFGDEQLLVLTQEEALADPQRTFEQTLGHLGVAKVYDVNQVRLLSTRKNRGPDVAMPPQAMDYLVEMFAPEYRRLRTMFGGSLPTTWNQGF